MTVTWSTYFGELKSHASYQCDCYKIHVVHEEGHVTASLCVIASLDYIPIGPRFSNLVLQALLVLLRKLPPVVSYFTVVTRGLVYILLTSITQLTLLTCIT